MKKWIFGFLIMFVLLVNGNNCQMSGEDEEVPEMSEEHTPKL